ncbi:DUF2771 domain-containing protein [Streptomyces cellulosae]|jgi:hypothetical protein|uniref:DUF2771 domain-containing protein n=2 Tax=Streptomyces TaxID=1883 RepID=A0ABU3JAN0_9ACTN|nr:DUF2771 domain-containing protein [Streptomyces sp. McG7]MBT2908466.1 DUF2771 domain-containing protein [Streptomyces sp. McG8]MCX4477674.1 DUF2771 domain-containing protein [Streptomyces cellulosae]MDQ0488718.1 hypothetical protein [Streptomyces thermodiastaticus]MDT6971093.1 DUF2771 domain-containing protein [Streptomyces thermocarboxydus]MDX3415535.1 DUF2771 domain-containing protein [Streptomyces sp. MD20-1-1]MXQ59146.1 DUF2771 domain-containing protein [Streptomyces sp. XHT-2]MYQ3142
MTTLQSAVRRRRAVAAAGAVSAGLLLLSACDKPTAISTITVGSDSVSSEATCGGEGKALTTEALNKCLQDKDIHEIKVDPTETVRFGVDPDIADNSWTILLNGQPLVESTKKTYQAIPGSVFFNAQYGAQGDSTLVSVKEGGENEATGLWSFRLKKDED